MFKTTFGLRNRFWT